MDYKNGKIYMLEPTCEYDEGDVYYGHTATTLVKRLSQHKRPASKLKSSKYLMDKYGRDNIKIVLMELYPCSCKDELKAVEAKYQRGNKCVNKNIAGRTDKEYKQDKREKISEQQKEYYQDKREKIIEQTKKYKAANREAIREKNKEYKAANREKINAKARELRAKKKSMHNV